MNSARPLRLPPWLRTPLPRGRGFLETRGLLDDLNLNTVCRGARCPNCFECFGQGTATFLILGRTCTRTCAFCNIGGGAPEPLDPGEPGRVAQAVERLNLTHAVVTSVTRDDLPDGGAAHFADTIRAIRTARAAREQSSGLTVEVLIPDFRGDPEALATVLDARPDVLNHNVETVPGLYPRIRPQADYAQSLTLLRRAAELAPGVTTKSGFMVGLGESDEEVRALVDDLAGIGCGMVTVGQYLRPSIVHPPVERYPHPSWFDELAQYGRSRGIPTMFCGPLVRSSYHAGEFVRG
jgi:lipoic acid synthetase